MNKKQELVEKENVPKKKRWNKKWEENLKKKSKGEDENI